MLLIINYFVLMLIPIFHLFFYQLKTFNLRDSLSCLKAFKSNNLLGLIIFLNILAGKNLI